MKQAPFPLFLLGLLILCLNSCATKKDQEFVEIDSEDVQESLIKGKKNLDKFSIKKGAESAPVPPKEASDQAEVKKGKPASQDKSKVPPSPKEGQASKVDSSSKKKKSLYPEDYPEVFKKYDKVSESSWERFQPTIYVGETFTFEVSYLGITAGYIKMETLPPVALGDVPVFHFKARMRSARYYSAIYTLDDSIESYVTRKNFIPLKYVLLQRESAQKVDDLQLFDRDELKTYHFYKRLKRGKRKEVELEKPIPRYFQDSYSALYFVRGFPLKKGDRYEFPIVTRGKIWILKIDVIGEEVIEVMDRDIKAIRIKAETRFPGVLEKKGDIVFWYSADEKKKLLRFEAQVKIGSVAGELVDYESGDPL